VKSGDFVAVFDKINTRYEGEYSDNEKNGKGTYYYPSRSKYEGEWRDGKKHGTGVYFYSDGSRFEGEFEVGKKHGKGVYQYPNGTIYEGEWKNGLLIQVKVNHNPTKSSCNLVPAPFWHTIFAFIFCISAKCALNLMIFGTNLY
jgi:hypothetical protein